jgi:hypothetical protein
VFFELYKKDPNFFGDRSGRRTIYEHFNISPFIFYGALLCQYVYTQLVNAFLVKHYVNIYIYIYNYSQNFLLRTFKYPCIEAA